MRILPFVIPPETQPRKVKELARSLSVSVPDYMARLERVERANRIPERAQSAALCWLLEPDPQTADDGIRRSVR